MSFEARSEALVELLAALDDRNIEYVLVGGYAVAAFSPRFSTDLDLVVAPEQRAPLIEFLETREFEQVAAHSKEWTYDTEVLQYEKRLGPQQPIEVDILVNGLGSRQTTAQWSFEYLRDHSTRQTIEATSSSPTARVVDGAVLVAAKLHSGRETDLRDVVAVAAAIDLDAVTLHLHRGDGVTLQDQLQQGLEHLQSEELRHGFRSDFGAEPVSESTIDTLRSYLETQIERLPLAAE